MLQKWMELSYLENGSSIKFMRDYNESVNIPKSVADFIKGRVPKR